MTAMGALRAGCGGVRVFSTDSNRFAVHAAVPEAVFIDRNADDAVAALTGTRAMVVGPGVGTDEAAVRAVQLLLTRYSGSIVLDADALTLLAAGRISVSDDLRPRCVLTPHPGELARLIAGETAAVLADPEGSARVAADRFGCVVLAKGTPSLIASPGGPLLISASGHKGVATGGMGDTLAGIVAALLAGGLTPREAAAAGVHFAGRAAEVAGRGRGLLPRDVADAIPEVLERRGPFTPARDAIVFELPPSI
jgi:NAD(P)H-hydrate epimerase